ncbi:hypothetical protein EUTSA_v10009793mg [Eutrema salsugineum]|uniref:Uncharacterized protein n=1 Tax=Eutrema salsugineum TaxID=72664 RepID=V4KZA3_EUTSA|nr:hypothetical protein EUTSA_v10009793mg [Eutrema salsugineum]
MLYFNLDPKDYISSHDHLVARRCVGWAGIIFTTFSCIDAAVRPKHKGVRIFDEVSLVCLHTALYALFYSMFKQISMVFMGVACFGVFIALLDAIITRYLEAVIEALKNGNDNYPARALILMAINSEDPATIAIIDLVKKRSMTTTTTTASTTV